MAAGEGPEREVVGILVTVRRWSGVFLEVVSSIEIAGDSPSCWSIIRSFASSSEKNWRA